MLTIDLEDLGDAAQERQFALVHQAIRLGDVEQAVEDVFEHGTVRLAGAAQGRHLPRICLEPGDILAREIIETRHVAPLPLGNRENLLEGAHLILCDDAVRLGHLCRQGDHGDGKRDPAAKLRIALEHRAYGFDDTAQRGG